MAEIQNHVQGQAVAIPWGWHAMKGKGKVIWYRMGHAGSCSKSQHQQAAVLQAAGGGGQCNVWGVGVRWLRVGHVARAVAGM